ncbi:hypothetical protein BGZ95_005249 [Linnemannia exigua]|uniref:Uncharacterized protein n=1 Tax=Linnemannia exigua TaxID=604196 RepID=A0AAD4H7R9_9FUNG|nr:hypothetical protein BGZ95_005249 [Linnemannia exigua]
MDKAASMKTYVAEQRIAQDRQEERQVDEEADDQSRSPPQPSLRRRPGIVPFAESNSGVNSRPNGEFPGPVNAVDKALTIKKKNM